MSIRDLPNEKPAVTAAVAGAVLLLVGGMWLLRGGGQRPPEPQGRYFYDLNTQTIVVGGPQDIAPVDLGGGSFAYPQGSAGSAVEAYLVSCNDCSGVAEGMTLDELKSVDAHVPYVMRYTPEGRAALERMHAPASESAAAPPPAGQATRALISDTQGKSWSFIGSPPSLKLLQVSAQLCGGAAPKRCIP